MHRDPELLGCRKAPQALLWAAASVQHRDGVVRSELHRWKMRYKGCSLHQNNLTGCDGFPLTFSNGITNIENKQVWCCERGHKNPTAPHGECLRTALCVTHRCEHVGILTKSCHPLTSSPQGIRIFSVCLLLCPHLVLVLANEFLRGPGWGVAAWRWHMTIMGSSSPKISINGKTNINLSGKKTEPKWIYAGLCNYLY